jgi:predicted nucleic acid-binding protein
VPGRGESGPERAAAGFDPVALNDFVSPFRVVQLSRMIAWRAALLQTSLTRRLAENDAWIAATAITYGATLVGRDRTFTRVPRLDYLTLQR